MMELLGEKTTEPGKPDLSEGSVPVKSEAIKGVVFGQFVSTGVKRNLLPAKDCSTESESEILSD